MDAAIIRQGELVGRGVMAYETTEELGTVEHLLVDVKLAQVIGLVCKAAGLMGRRQSLSWAQLANIGRDSLVVCTEAAPAIAAANESQLAAAQNMTGLEVWTDGGDHIGRIVDVCLDQATGKVQQYLFALNQTNQTEKQVADSAALAESSDFTSASEAAEEETVEVYTIEPQSIISAGRKRMMIAEEDARRSPPYAQPLLVPTAPSRSHSRSHSRSGPWRLEQRPEMPNDFNDLLQKGQSLAGKVSQQIKQRAQQFTDEQLANQDFVEANSLPDITEQLQSKTEQVKQQMQAQLKKAKEKAQDQIDHNRLKDDLEDRLGNTSLGRSLGQTLERFKRPKKSEQVEPIDVDAFEVWEED
ncbi:MAG: PRC-barrel domain-containing protein [Phormidesmis sp.]